MQPQTALIIKVNQHLIFNFSGAMNRESPDDEKKNIGGEYAIAKVFKEGRRELCVSPQCRDVRNSIHEDGARKGFSAFGTRVFWRVCALGLG